MRKLRAYSQAAIYAMLKHVEEDVIRPEELVMVLASGALYVQLTQVMRTLKVPMGLSVHDLYEGSDPVEVSPEYLEMGEPAPSEILPKIAKTRKKK